MPGDRCRSAVIASSDQFGYHTGRYSSVPHRTMSKIIEIKIGSEPRSLVAKAEKAAREKGMEFFGDETSGRFSGHGVDGVYEFRGDVLAITITRKPFVLPWAVIEASVKGFFA
ncbi:hypothetical protein KW113_00760 [Methylococcus capsulatus]|nr:hypothetical protein KW112_08875 [Methylococcus capsulatus]QXP93796.1 hypothetical protein KW113_00760 [Methylococcus capsulatus]